ncbi:MAG: PD40 domain-containing protein [Flavobacteriales bacterium]|nr:PD40 domain-containing protein [Flavobacteriales bacterium]
MEFGKNRVQYQEFDWYYLPADKFHVYFYQGGQDLAEYVVLSTRKNLPEVEHFFDYTLDETIQVLTYQKQTEYRQSNLGITNDDQFAIGGTARILGNKMFVYYEGDHESLEYQVRSNLARIIFSQLMFGGDWKDVIRNSTMLSVPAWYEEGIISLAAEPWNAETENFMRDLLADNKFKSLNRFAGDEARWVGHAFWRYITDIYGEGVIPNILYMTKMSRSIDSGFLLILGVSLDELAKDFIEYYRQQYDVPLAGSTIPGAELGPKPEGKRADIRDWKKRARHMGAVAVRYKPRYNYSQFKESPDGKYVAYVTNELGQYKIWMYDVEKGSAKKILKREHKLDRIPDKSFPVLTWHPSSKVLTYTFEIKGRAWIGNYNLEDGKRTEKELFRIDKVVNFSYSPDGKKMVFTGVKEGKTDLFLYQVIGNNQEQLTFDVYDDMDARFVNNGTAIIFASNRTDDTLRSKIPNDIYPLQKDIFIYDLANRSEILERLTSTPYDEKMPAQYDATHYTFLGDASGIYNRYLAARDSAILTIDTAIHYRYFTTIQPLSSYARSPEEYEFDASSGKYSLTFRTRARNIFYSGRAASDFALNLQGSLPEAKGGEVVLSSDTYVIATDTTDVGNVDINNYEFEDDRLDYTHEKEAVRMQEIGSATTDTTAEKPFVMPKSRRYRLNFATDYVLTQVDNSFTSPFYQNFTGPTSVLPGVSGLIKLGMSDLFEDYKVIGGFRLSVDLENNDYGITFENLKGKVDKKMTFFRQSQQMATDVDVFKSHTHSFQYQWRIPFNELASLRINTVYRYDRFIRQSVDPVSLVTPNYNEHNLGVRLEYVYDNTRSRGLNLYNGTRYKLWIESYRQPDKYEEKTDFNVIGFDFRHYEKIHRDLIAAFRVAASSSFGQYKLVHFLGGEDNWLFQRVDNGMPIATNQNYWFQALATPMRGFYVNARNGNSVAFANAEVRWPVFKYFMRSPIKSDFLQHFQLISFFDAGTAWTGPNPYSDENMLNSQSVTVNPVTVTINNNREPVIYGYGFGVRSRVLGYFMRADWSWGIDDGRVLPRVFYLSLNLDF